MKAKLTYISLLAALTLTSCGDKGWGINGTIQNAPDGAMVSVEGFNAGIWYNIDSVEVNNDGKFAYRSPQGSPYPDVYRVSLDGRYIYFPIDSLESVTIVADANDFDRSYTLEGSQMAIDMMDIDQRIAQAVSAQGAEAVLADSLLKLDLGRIINEDTNGVLGYYIINKTVGDRPLFTTTDKVDVRILGALANKFMINRPNDPRTQYLCRKFLSARAQINPESVPLIEAKESGYIDIEMYDARGVKRKLSDVVNASGLTILNFTSYQIEPSVAINIELNRLAEKYKGNNLSIYQVSVDTDDEVQWRHAASNLPWTAVWYDGKDGGTLLNMYNVQAIPATYIIDRSGVLVDRVDDLSTLEEVVRKHL